MAPNDLSERRQHQRHRVFRIEVKVATASAFRASYLRDVSAGGIFVRSHKPLPQGTRVVIELGVAGTLPLRIPGEVVRLEANGFGVRFDALTDEQQLGLNALVAANTAPPPAPEAEDLHSVRLQLAEAHGEIEAYEQSLANAREHEMEAVQRAERAELERELFERTTRELTAKLAAVEAERSRLTQVLQSTQARLTTLDAEHRGLETERSQAQKVSQALEGELERLRFEFSTQRFDEARRELQELTEQLSDEKLKNMALQRALERFAAMGGKVGLNG